MLNDDLLEAYKAAKYIFTYQSQDIRIEVDKKCPQLDEIFKSVSATKAFFITPENPFSLELSKSENSLRHNRFKQMLEDNNLIFFEGYGTDEEETWPREISYMVFTDNDSLMHTLAGQFGQNAFIAILPNHAPKLMLHNPISYQDIDNVS